MAMNLKKSLVALGVTVGFAVGVVAELGDPKKLPAPADKKVDFVKEIKPVLEKSCVKCHSGRRPKSKYRMDTQENTFKGGSSEEKAIIPKDSAKSPFVHYIADVVEELEMPPIDKRDRYPKLTTEQIALVRAWIDQGAAWPKDVVLEVPEEE